MYDWRSSTKHNGESSTRTAIYFRIASVIQELTPKINVHTRQLRPPREIPKLYPDCWNETAYLNSHRQRAFGPVSGEQSCGIAICAENTMDGLFCQMASLETRSAGEQWNKTKHTLPYPPVFSTWRDPWYCIMDWVICVSMSASVLAPL